MSSKHIFSVPISGASLKLRLVIFNSSLFPMSKIQELAKLIEDFCMEHQQKIALQFEEEDGNMENDLSYRQSEINGEGEQE